MDKKLSMLTVALVLAIAFSPAVPAEGPQHDHEKEPPQDEHAGHKMHEGAITFSDGNQEYKAKVLGGRVGQQSVQGVTVSLFVLQAESPERLGPDGSGPTHLFNVTFVLEDDENLIEGAAGTVVVSGKGEPRRIELAPFQSHYQARVRLDEPGDYALQVEFAAGGKSGATEPMKFAYRWSPEIAAAVEAAVEGDGETADHSEHEHHH